MIGIDTNIFVRYLVQDDEKQSRIASEIFEKKLNQDAPGFVSSIVLVEMVWTLKRSYKIDKETIHLILEKLLTTVELNFECREEAWKALQLCHSEGLDFSDALIRMIIHQTHKCDITLTFDKGAAKIPFFKLAH